MKLSIQLKLILAILVAASTVAGSVSFVALTGVARLTRRVQSLFNDSLLPLVCANAADDTVDQMRLNSSSAMHADEGSRAVALVRLAESRTNFELQIAKYEGNFTADHQPEMQALLQRYGTLETQDDAERRALADIRQESPRLQDALRQFQEHLQAGRRAEAQAIYANAMAPALDVIARKLDTLKRLQLEEFTLAGVESRSLGDQAKLLTSLVSVLGVLAGIGMGLLVVHPIIRGIRTLSAAMGGIAAGNLGHRVDIRSQDELGALAHTFNAMSIELASARKNLELARDASEAGSLAKSEFLASMSHEIRTPMNGVLGMLGLLLDTELSARQHEIGEVALSSAEHLLTIINDILDFSKITAGKLDIELSPFDLRKTVEEVAAMAAVQCWKKGIEVIVRYPPDTPFRVVGDAGRVRQVLTNLVGNAAKFTEAGHVLIDLGRAADGGEARFHFRIQDTGIGIPADKLNHVFGRFSQADASTTRRYGGTGLGLAISKQLVQLMGGTIGVDSVVGQGSSFWFTLPLLPDRDAPAVTLLNVDLSSVRVLIVDNNEVSRGVLRELMSAWGMRSGNDCPGAAALDVLRAALASGDPYHIALLDRHMPGIDVVELAKAIKSDPGLRGTSLVLLDAVGSLADTVPKDLFAIYIVKPVRPSQFREVLAGVWKRPTGGAAAAASPGGNARAVRATRPPRNARVLVVDDNPVNQKVASMMLGRLGFRVDVASNGQEAVDMVEMLPYDAILMDCEMPVLDGFQATAAIRGRPEAGHRIPIVAMTARALEGDRERCLQAGMDDYLSKPVQYELLEAMLDRWVPSEASPADVLESKEPAV